MLKPFNLALVSAVLKIFCLVAALNSPLAAVADETGTGPLDDPAVQAHPELLAAVEKHEEGRLEDSSKALKKAIKLLEDLTQKEPENALARAYLGSATALVGRVSWNPLTKVKYANLGTKNIDRAVAMDGDLFSVRIVSFRVNEALPDMFDRKEAAIADGVKLHELFEAANRPEEQTQTMAYVYKRLSELDPDNPDWAVHQKSIKG